MYISQLINGAYRVIRDDGLVIAEVAGKDQLDPCSDGNLVAWASFNGPQYVICSRTVDGSTLGPIVQQSANIDEDAIHPFLANGWLFWSQLRSIYSTYAKNLTTGAVVGPWVSEEHCGGCWAWAATPTQALAANRLHWGKTYNINFLTAIMFDFTVGQFMSFNQAINPDTLVLAYTFHPNGLIIRNTDAGRLWESKDGRVCSVYTEVSGNDFVVKWGLNQCLPNQDQAGSWEMWQRIVHPDGMMEPGTLVQKIDVALAPDGQVMTEVPSWL